MTCFLEVMLGLCLLPYFACARPTVVQQIQFGDGAPQGKKAHVLLLTDVLEVTAGSPQEVDLRFRVEDGFHINSHTPKDELLLPTALRLDAAESLKVLGEQYPAGTPFHLQMDPTQTLDVYQSDFRVRVRIVASRGSSVLTGELHYQACDHAACFPPRTLPVKVLVAAR